MPLQPLHRHTPWGSAIGDFDPSTATQSPQIDTLLGRLGLGTRPVVKLALCLGLSATLLGATLHPGLAASTLEELRFNGNGGSPQLTLEASEPLNSHLRVEEAAQPGGPTRITWDILSAEVGTHVPLDSALKAQLNEALQAQFPDSKILHLSLQQFMGQTPMVRVTIYIQAPPGHPVLSKGKGKTLALSFSSSKPDSSAPPWSQPTTASAPKESASPGTRREEAPPSVYAPVQTSQETAKPLYHIAPKPATPVTHPSPDTGLPRIPISKKRREVAPVQVTTPKPEPMATAEPDSHTFGSDTSTDSLAMVSIPDVTTTSATPPRSTDGQSIQQLRTRVNDLTFTLEAQKRREEQLVRAVKAAHQELARQRNQQAQQQDSASAATIQQLQQENETLKKAMARAAEQQMAIMQQHMAANEAKMASLQRQMEQWQSSGQQTVGNLRQQLQATQEHLDNLRSENHQYESKINRLKSENMDYVEKITTLSTPNEQVAAMKSRLEKTLGQLTSATATIEQQNGKIKTLEEKLTTLSSQGVVNTREDVAFLNALLDKKEALVEEQAQTIKQLEAQLTQGGSSSDQPTSTSASVSAPEGSSATVLQLEQELQQARDQLKTLETRHSQSELEMAQTINDLKQRLRDGKSAPSSPSVNEQLKKTTEALEKRVHEAEATNRKLQNQLTEAQQEAKTAKSHQQQLQEQLKLAQQQQNQASAPDASSATRDKALEKAQETIETLQKEREYQDKKLADLRKDMSRDLEKALAQIDTLRREKETLQAKVQDVQTQAEALLKQPSSLDTSKLEKALHKQAKVLEETRKRLTQRDQDLDNAKDTIDELKDTLKKSDKQLTQAQEDVEKLNKKIAEGISSAPASQPESAHAQSQTQAELKAAREQIAWFETQIKTLKDERVQLKEQIQAMANAGSPSPYKDSEEPSDAQPVALRLVSPDNAQASSVQSEMEKKARTLALEVNQQQALIQQLHKEKEDLFRVVQEQTRQLEAMDTSKDQKKLIATLRQQLAKYQLVNAIENAQSQDKKLAAASGNQEESDGFALMAVANPATPNPESAKAAQKRIDHLERIITTLRAQVKGRDGKIELLEKQLTDAQQVAKTKTPDSQVLLNSLITLSKKYENLILSNPQMLKEAESIAERLKDRNKDVPDYLAPSPEEQAAEDQAIATQIQLLRAQLAKGDTISPATASTSGSAAPAMASLQAATPDSTRMLLTKLKEKNDTIAELEAKVKALSKPGSAPAASGNGGSGSQLSVLQQQLISLNQKYEALMREYTQLKTMELQGQKKH